MGNEQMPNRLLQVDAITIVGLALVLLPLEVMTHEIGGHAVICAVTGGLIQDIGAFYVNCDAPTLWAAHATALAGVAIDTTVSCIAFLLWRRTTGDFARLVFFYVWIMKGFVAAGYLLFSGISDSGDLGTALDAGMSGIANPILWRIAIIMIGGFAYWRLIRAAIRALDTMVGDTPETQTARRKIAHIFYITIGLASVVVGLLNPVGIMITIMSAAASSFGGNAGFISVGYADPKGTQQRKFLIKRNWYVFIAGLVLLGSFALILGPTLHFSS